MWSDANTVTGHLFLLCVLSCVIRQHQIHLGQFISSTVQWFYSTSLQVPWELLEQTQSCQCGRTDSRQCPAVNTKSTAALWLWPRCVGVWGWEIAEFLPPLTLLPHPAHPSIAIFTPSVVKMVWLWPWGTEQPGGIQKSLCSKRLQFFFSSWTHIGIIKQVFVSLQAGVWNG